MFRLEDVRKLNGEVMFGRLPINIYVWPAVFGWGVYEEWEGLTGGSWSWRPTFAMAVRRAQHIADQRMKSGEYEIVFP